jgi:hypothetical protein
MQIFAAFAQFCQLNMLEDFRGGVHAREARNWLYFQLVTGRRGLEEDRII